MRRLAALLVLLAPAVAVAPRKLNAGADPLGVYQQVPDNLIALDQKHRRIEWDFSLDAYYSSAGMIINFTDKPIENVGEASEAKVYENLLLSPLVPRYAILEASVNPMPVAGVLVREHANDVYQRAQVGGESFNLIRSATRGFQEPYAVSFFLGRVVRYQPLTRTAEEKEKNRHSGYQSSLGYTGYLVSYGSHHIKDNELFNDHWVEIEWKVKGDQLFTLHKMQWNYRIGVKLHDNPYISDIAFIGFRRNRLDYTADAWDFLANSGFEYRIDFKIENLKPVRQYFEVNKKWPIRQFAAFSVALGFTWESDSLYSGPLDNYPGGENFQVLLRPNVEF
jgi:hypothetical protein